MNEHYPFVNPELPYAYNALEPFIDTKTMQLHHDRHLQNYVNQLNNAISGYPQYHSWTLKQLIYQSDRLPPAIRRSVLNNAGGVFNHIFFFDGMINPQAPLQSGALLNAIVRDFGSEDKFKELFKKQALSVFGSGYAGLVTDQNGKLQVVTSANQDTPLVKNLCPVLVIDVWEHAYYLKHYNERAAYIDDWFRVINWELAEELYKGCVKKAHKNQKPQR